MGLRMLPGAKPDYFGRARFPEKSEGHSCTQLSHLGRDPLQETRFPDLHEHPRCPGAIRAISCNAQSLHLSDPFGVTHSLDRTEPQPDLARARDMPSNGRWHHPNSHLKEARSLDCKRLPSNLAGSSAPPDNEQLPRPHVRCQKA